MNNTALYLKFLSVVLIIATMIALNVVKCYIKELDVAQINFVLLQLLTGLGVYHMTSKDSPPQKDPS